MDYTFEDAFSMLDPARRVLLRFGLSQAASEVKEWTAELQGLNISASDSEEIVRDPLDDCLPASETIIVDFVGREEEIEALGGWFASPNSRRWALAGEGGKGKSAIAYHFATKIKTQAPAPFQIVIWLSAKRRRFDDGEIRQIGLPDFANLSTALDKLLDIYGWDEAKTEPTQQKREIVLRLFNEFPAFLVIDDADSLEGESEDAIEFFTLDAPNTRTKVLFTSRRVLFGMGSTTTHISGLSGQDALDFISSRCRLTELDFSSIKPHVPEMLKVTEGSPLFLEDLLRLCSVVPVLQALSQWRERGGDTAREYALGRELDMLSSTARLVLLAAAMPSKPVAHFEIEAMTGLSGDQVSSALRELQKLFLVPKPAIFEGEERYNVNLNTRLLVKKVEAKTDAYRRISEAWANMTKGAEFSHDEIVTAAIRRANVLVRGRDIDTAEKTLQTALHLRPNQPNLLGFLGWVYKASNPRRITDARETFERAQKLGCKNTDMYRHWAEMELEQKEWGRAANAAEAGLALEPNNGSLLHAAGYSMQRLGRELLNGLHSEKGIAALIRAKGFLSRAIEVGSPVRSDSFRAMALCCEGLGHADGLKQLFARWSDQFPHSIDAQSEKLRLAAKFHLTI